MIPKKKSSMGSRSRNNDSIRADSKLPPKYLIDHIARRLPVMFRVSLRKVLKNRIDLGLPLCEGVAIEVEWPACPACPRHRRARDHAEPGDRSGWPSTDCHELPKYEITFCPKDMIDQCLQPVVLQRFYVYRECCPACMRTERARTADPECPDTIIQIKPIDDRFNAFK